MAQCLEFYETQQSNGVDYVVFIDNKASVDDCGNGQTIDRVSMTPTEYVQIKTEAGHLVNYDELFGLIDPVDVAAVFGICFALVVSISGFGYGIKVAKRVIKLA